MAFKVAKAKQINTKDLQSLGQSTVDLAKYVEDEFAQVASSLQGDDPFNVLFVAPPKPRQGMLVYADGTHWNPGSGEGFYEYTSGGLWVPLSDSAVVSPIPSGTVMLFYQASAPTGWTKITSQNDKALRVVSGSGGVAGGTNAFSTVMAQTVVGGHALSLAEIPSHTHSVGSGLQSNSSSPGTTFTAGTQGWAGAQTSGSAGSGNSHNHTITMDIQYIDLILASKN